MRVILYNSGLGPKVASGEKTTTIRQRARCRPGDVLSHREWTGLPYRSKQRELCRTKCQGVQRITIREASCTLECEVKTVSDEQELKHPKNLDMIARSDGFSTWQELVNWFTKTHGLPFTGELIRW